MGELVRGIADPEVKTLVLSEVEPQTDLKSLVKLIQTKEYAKSTSTPQVVAEISGKSEGSSCGNCGKSHEKGRKNCPAYDKTCTNCEKKGHFRAVCKSAKKKPAKSKKVNNVEEKKAVADSKSLKGIFKVHNITRFRFGTDFTRFPLNESVQSGNP